MASGVSTSSHAAMIDADGCVDGHCETREKESTQGRDVDRPQVILKRDKKADILKVNRRLYQQRKQFGTDSTYFRNSNDENGN